MKQISNPTKNKNEIFKIEKMLSGNGYYVIHRITKEIVDIVLSENIKIQ